MLPVRMRGIFSRLLLSFSLIILLSAVISAAIMFSFSRRSNESFRQGFLQDLHANIARSVIVMGKAAYVMRQHQPDKQFRQYLEDMKTSLGIELSLYVDGVFVAGIAAQEDDLAEAVAMAGTEGKPFIKDTGRELLVSETLPGEGGTAYTIVGVHRFKSMGKPGGVMPPPPPPGPAPGGGPPPHHSFFSRLKSGPELQTAVLLVFGGVLCFLLARSFSKPLQQLRTASRQIAQGNLSARVGSPLGRPGNEIADLARDFDTMAERMEGLVNAQKRLLRDISHELRSPLARLNLALELVTQRFHAEEDVHILRIARESDRLNTLIGQLLTLAKMESGRVDAAAETIELDVLIREIADDVRFECSNRGQEVVIVQLEPVTVTGSKELLRQAIENVVRNGAWYTPPGTAVEISLMICADPPDNRSEALIHIRDHGPGVPEEAFPRILDPFFRVSEARDRASGGTGIGLAITHQAVQQHGGMISLSNATSGQGFIVAIRLPLPPVERAESEASLSANALHRLE